MNFRQLACAVMLSGLAASAGYYVGALRQDPSSYVLRQAQLSVDDFYAPQSFSEVENTKALLSALSRQFITGIYAERTANNTEVVLNTRGNSAVEPHLLAVIKQLEQGVAEFKGTKQELDLVQPLLAALKKAKLYDRWMEAYLNALYQHPTDPMIGRLATEAISVSKAAGRQSDVLNGFEHLRNIPLEFGVNLQVEQELARAQTEGLLAAH